MKRDTLILIGAAVVGVAAWAIGRRKSAQASGSDFFDFGGGVAPPPPVPAGSAGAGGTTGTFAYWSKLDAQAVKEFTSANRERMLAAGAGNKPMAAQWQERYDAAFARHQEYARKANDAYNQERGTR